MTTAEQYDTAAEQLFALMLQDGFQDAKFWKSRGWSARVINEAAVKYQKKKGVRDETIREMQS